LENMGREIGFPLTLNKRLSQGKKKRKTRTAVKTVGKKKFLNQAGGTKEENRRISDSLLGGRDRI